MNLPKGQYNDLIDFFSRPLAKHLLDDFENQDVFCLVGIRGYFANTYGKKGVNDRQFYDDALFIVLAKKVIESFNFNSDPSLTYRNGLATLKANEKYKCIKWKHRGKYSALQIIEDKLVRDGKGSRIYTGRHGINFHYDAEKLSKYSLGCQTIPYSQWERFIKGVYALMDSQRLTTVNYYLIENRV